MFPADEILIARGKHATLSKERRQQIERVQDICRTIMATAPLILADCQKRPPEDPKLIQKLEHCIGNLTTARERIITTCLGMEELHDEAWG